MEKSPATSEVFRKIAVWNTAFLGDAVLGAVVAEYLFKLFPKKDEGFLTQMRSRIVNGQNLFMLSKKFGFDTNIYFQSF